MTEETEKSAPPAQKPPSAILGAVKFALKIAIALAIVAWLVSQNPREIIASLASFKIQWLALAAALYAFHLFANAWRWWLLLRAQGIECRLIDAVSITMQSFFFSLVIPGGAIGGDIVRAGFLASRVPPGRKFDGAFSILMDRLTGMIGIFLVAIIMLPFSWWALSKCGGRMDLPVKLIVAGSIAGLLASIMVFHHRKLERIPILLKCKQLADRFSGGLPSRIADALDTYNNCPKTIVTCILSSMVFVNLTLGLVAHCLALGAGVESPPLSATIAAITIGNIVGLLPLTPSGVGARDVFVIAIMAAAGIPLAQATACALALTALILGFNLLGGLFFIYTPKAGKDSSPQA